jgi:hypothetical protein
MAVPTNLLGAVDSVLAQIKAVADTATPNSEVSDALVKLSKGIEALTLLKTVAEVTAEGEAKKAELDAAAVAKTNEILDAANAKLADVLAEIEAAASNTAVDQNSPDFIRLSAMGRVYAATNFV